MMNGDIWGAGGFLIYLFIIFRFVIIDLESSFFPSCSIPVFVFLLILIMSIFESGKWPRHHFILTTFDGLFIITSLSPK